jgi:hypothetical protein
MTDPGAPAEVGLALAAEAEQAADVLVFYYVGHGLVSEDGQLYLATRMTVSDQSRLRYTALAYADVRKTLLDSPARSLVVLLDCCFSGRATGGVLGDELGEVGSLTEIHGGFVLTAAGRSEPAFAPPGQRHTAFTGQLLRLLVDGHPDAPPHWTLHDMHRFLARELVALGLSRPQCRAFGRVGELVLASNLAWRAPASENAQQTLDDPGSRQRAVTVEGVCPYKGLAAFQQGDARWFFGRERLTATVVQRMASTYDDPGLLVVVGASGAGKSSLLRAGLLPALGHGEASIAGSATWPQLLMTPTSEPIRSLATAVAAVGSVDVDILTERLHNDPRQLVHVLRQTLRARYGDGEHDSHRIILVVDQFEQTFTLCDDENERALFVQALNMAALGADGPPPALVVIGMRADFYHHCAALPELRPALQQRQVIVGPMSTTELRAAIEKPAAVAGLALQSGLVDLLLHDLDPHFQPRENNSAADTASANPGRPDTARLPLLSHTLRATWQQREGHLLTITGYRATGGIAGAVAQTAEHAYTTLDEAGKNTARHLLLHLVHLAEGGQATTRRVDRDRLIREVPDPTRASAVLDVFSAQDARLITIDDNDVGITHEALLHVWPRLRNWVEADRAGLLVRQRLLDAAHGWQQERRDPAALYRGSQLDLAREWAADHPGTLGPITHDFVQASIRADRRRAQTRIGAIAALAILLVLSLITTGLAVQRQREARAQQRIATVQGLLAQANAGRDNAPRLSLMLNLAADAIQPSLESKTSLVNTLTTTHYKGTLIGHTDVELATAFSPDGHLLATASWDRTVILWDLTNPARPHQIGRPLSHTNRLWAVAFSPDGRTLATAGTDKTVILWDITDPGEPRQFGQPLAAHSATVASLNVQSRRAHTRQRQHRQNRDPVGRRRSNQTQPDQYSDNRPGRGVAGGIQPRWAHLGHREL